MVGNTFANYLSNGDFESGNVSIFSDYNYITSPPLIGDNEYVITENPSLNHPDSISISGSSGSGLMMMIRAGGNNEVTAWTQTITGLGTERYSLQVMMANLWTPWAHLKVYANGQEVNSCGTSIVGHWMKCGSSNLYADAAGELSLDIISGYGANTYMFAMDDLILTEYVQSPPIIPEPVSSTLFIVGGATLGFRRFRKKFKK
jgi:hypothetical protein